MGWPAARNLANINSHTLILSLYIRALHFSSLLTDNNKAIKESSKIESLYFCNLTFLMATQHQNHVPEAVSVRKSVSVYPKTSRPDQILRLSNLDRQCPTLMYLVLFYKFPSINSANSPQTLSLDSVFSSLKSGLEETLSVWYPAAGRLSLSPDDGKLNIWCNNRGAVLIEAVTRVSISELGDLSQYNEFFEKLVYKPAFNGDFSEMPLLVAQVIKI